MTERFVLSRAGKAYFLPFFDGFFFGAFFLAAML
jgi:hypothetical protein